MASRTPIEESFSEVIEAYQSHLGHPDWKQFPYEIALHGVELRVTVQVDDAERTLRGRFSEVPFLAARYWGATHAAYPKLPVMLPSLQGPLQYSREMATVERPSLDAFLEACIEPLHRVAVYFAGHDGDDEAVMCLRRTVLEELSDLAGDWARSGRDSQNAGSIRRKLPRGIPRALMDRVVTIPDEEVYVSEKDSWGLTTLAKHYMGLVPRKDCVERAFASEGFSIPIRELHSNNVLNLYALCRDPLRRLVDDKEPYVRERALSAMEIFARKLFTRQAYLEALDLLDTMVEYGIAPWEHLRWRWECRLALGDDTAEEDWELSSHLAPDGPLRMDASMWSLGDRSDFRGAALTRVADAHVDWALGKDPCGDRRMKKADSRRLMARKQDFLSCAERHLGEAEGIVEPRVARDLARANKATRSPTDSLTYRGFQSATYEAKSRLAEQKGEWKEALRLMKRAREVRKMAGLKWRTKALDEDIQRLKLAAQNAPTKKGAAPGKTRAVPPKFDAKWMMAPGRSPDELEQAAKRWEIGKKPAETHKKSRGNWAPFAERYFAELVFAATGDMLTVARITRLFCFAEGPGLLPTKKWLREAQGEQALASAKLAEALWTYFLYHLDTCYQRNYTRDDKSLFWPLVPLWVPSLEPRLIEYYQGKHDRRRATRGVRKQRTKLLRWITENVSAPALEAALDPSD